MKQNIEETLRKINVAKKSRATYLDLSKLGLAELPNQLWGLIDLKILHLGENRLTSLPPEVGQLTNLTRLGLYKNQLASLPIEIWELTKLKDLYLEGNKLANLPPGISKLKNLEWLILRDNDNLEMSESTIQTLENNGTEVLLLSYECNCSAAGDDEFHEKHCRTNY